MQYVTRGNYQKKKKKSLSVCLSLSLSSLALEEESCHAVSNSTERHMGQTTEASAHQSLGNQSLPTNT